MQRRGISCGEAVFGVSELPVSGESREACPKVRTQGMSKSAKLAKVRFSRLYVFVCIFIPYTRPDFLTFWYLEGTFAPRGQGFIYQRIES